MMGNKGILLAGVGGQGVLRASDILCRTLMSAEFDVKKSEVHGMSQRGGCVTSHVRYGRKVHSPIAKKGDVDILLSFESMDTLRYLDYVRESGLIIINDMAIPPPSVNLGEAVYPSNVPEIVNNAVKSVISYDAGALAARAGNIRSVGTVLLGSLSSYLDIPLQFWEQSLRSSFSAKLLSINIEAFHLGRDVIN